MQEDLGDNELGEYVHRLEMISIRCRYFGRLVILMTLASLLLLVLQSMMMLYTRTVLLFASTTTSFAVMFALMHDQFRKQGDLLFEELSEELHWNLRGSGKTKSENSPLSEKPKMAIRLALREFSQSTDLPLFPGKYGPAIYLLVNIGALGLLIFSANIRRF